MGDAVTMDELIAVIMRYSVLCLAVLPWLCYLLQVTFLTVSITYGRLYLHRKSDPRMLVEYPGVSIIKPLMGADPFLQENLESHFTLDYPKFEILLCVQSDQDPAISVVRGLMERHPKVNAALFIGGKEGVLNPMVHNMAPAYEAAKYPVIWISTSRIKVNTDMLEDMMVKLQNPRVALVHQVPYMTDQPGLAAAVEKISFGASMARYYMTFHSLGVSCFTGMSYLLKKQELDDLNGMAWFGQFLPEDYFIAKLLHDKGYRHQLAAYPALQNVKLTTIVAYKNRMVRWLRLRMNLVPLAGCVLEPLGESFVLGIYASWSAYFFFDINPYTWFICHWVIWCGLDYIQLLGLQNGPLPFSKPMYVAAWIVRELLFVYIYFEALLNIRHISWGRNRYRLSNFGAGLEIVSQKSVLSV